ncbi:MAG: response regulator transcription factor [Hyphomicrobiaceae bacterium]|nr:response regulator transcription factor [Hyphomicrobiaceae bacterium]
MTGQRILVVDDEPQIMRFLKPSLKAAGYEVLAAADGKQALRAAATQAPDLILLDLGLPDMDGKAVLERIRGWSRVPVIVLSARDREAEKIAALDLGADDYVNKPFGIGELLARMRTALRHRGQAQAEQAVLSVGALTLDVAAHTVSLDGHALRLTRKEFDLLHVLMRSPGLVVTHRQILHAVWGPAHSQDVQYLRVFMGQLRQKLQAAGAAPDLIRTELGIGYRLQGAGG